MQPTIIILLLGARVVSVTGDCFYPSFTAGDAHYRECCFGDRRQGNGTIDGAPYEYECDAWTNSFYKGRPMQNAGQCARYCESNNPCSSAVFSPTTGYCFLSTDANAATSHQQGYLTLWKRGKRIASPGECQQQVTDATNDCNQRLNACNSERASLSKNPGGGAQCEADKANLRNELAVCRSEKDSLAQTMKTQYEAEKAACQSQLTTCTSDKASTEQKLRAECDAQKAQCQNALTGCNAEKASMSQTMTTQCDADKANCRKELSDTKTQLDACKASGSNGSTGSSGVGGDPEVAKGMSELGLKPLDFVCPRFNGKEFTTTTASGHKARWRILCSTFCNGHDYRDIVTYNGATIANMLKERQENKNYRGLFWNIHGVYHDVVPHPIFGWSQFTKTPHPLHAYIERLDFNY